MSDSDRKALLELRRVSHSYRARRSNYEQGEHRVLDDVSLSVYRGQTLGVIGRNGAGKTTLLRLMAGILEPNQGQVWRRSGVKCSLLSLGLGFQDQLTGRDNVLLSALLQGATRAEAHGCLEPVNEFAELGRSYNEPVKTYSAGMRARLGFATALQTRVDVLLIDEVLAVGDRQFRAKAASAMQRHLEGAQTVVLVSHNENQLERLCDRVAWIENGRLRLVGGATEVMTQYKTTSE
ncbi:MAG: ABC transporter ATP-binding protein [Pseudomonadota bacterium]